MTDGLRLVSATLCDEVRIELNAAPTMTPTGEHTMRELVDGGYRGLLATVISGAGAMLDDPNTHIAARVTRDGAVVAECTDRIGTASLNNGSWACVIPVEIARAEPGDYESNVMVSGGSLGSLPLALR